MQSQYRLPNPLPPLPVRKGVRGRRPKSQTIAMLKAAAEAAKNPINAELMHRPCKKRGPKPGSKRKPKVPHFLSRPALSSSVSDGRLSGLQTSRDHQTGVETTVCVYVNKHGDSGPHLDRKLLLQLPDHFGPGPVNTVLQHAVQACMDCAFQPKTLFSFLQSQSDGGEIIRVRSEGGIHYVKLPTASSAPFVLRFLETLCQHLGCDTLFSNQPLSPQTADTHTSETVTCAENCATTHPRLSEESVTRQTSALRSPTEHDKPAGSSPLYSSRPTALRRLSSSPSELLLARTHRREEAASSTTGPENQSADRHPSKTSNRNPSSWSVEEVMRFVHDADPQTLGPHAELFRKHEIDGKALMLLRSDMIMTYMGLKLGPALKLCHHIERLKQAKQ